MHLDELIFKTMNSSKKVLVLDTAVLVESFENVEHDIRDELDKSNEMSRSCLETI